MCPTGESILYLANMADKILIYGSSHVKKLKSFVEFSRPNLNLDQNRYSLYWKGRSGGKAAVAWAKRYTELWRFKGKKIVVLILGSNDLCDLRYSPFDVASTIYSLAEFITEQGVPYVIIGQIIRRQSMELPQFKIHWPYHID